MSYDRRSIDDIVRIRCNHQDEMSCNIGVETDHGVAYPEDIQLDDVTTVRLSGDEDVREQSLGADANKIVFESPESCDVVRRELPSMQSVSVECNR